MNLTHGPADTLGDELLLQHLHGEQEGEQRAAVDAHLAGCAQCGARLEALARRQQRISSALAASDFEPPATGEWRRMRTALASTADFASAHGSERMRGSRIAWLPWYTPRLAVIFTLTLLTALLVASPPVRAWVSAQWRTLAGAPAAPPRAADAPDGTAGIGFQPETPLVVVAFAAAQAGGSLHVHFTDDNSARLIVTDGGTEQLAIVRDTVSIANQPDSRASYDIILPESVTHLAISIAPADTLLLSRADGLVTEIDLSTGRVRNQGSHDDQ